MKMQIICFLVSSLDWLKAGIAGLCGKKYPKTIKGAELHNQQDQNDAKATQNTR